ncbi:MAG: peroxiredoxin [Moraxella sp.]|nr:peroxiredoxin [Moraxella sp.]
MTTYNTPNTLPTFSVSIIQKINGDFIEQNITLADFLKDTNKGLILYFYPKDNTQGCTLQAVEFSELIHTFDNKNYLIVGVSRDSIKSHQNFINKHNLTIALISDTDEGLCQYFDVIKEKMMYGKTHLGVVRSTFVFDNSGKLIHEFRNVKAKVHQQDLLSQL